MIRIYLTHFEFTHYSDLVAPPHVFRTEPDAREVKVKALESVIGMDYPRARLGDSAFEVYGGRTVETMPRWQ